MKASNHRNFQNKAGIQEIELILLVPSRAAILQPLLLSPISLCSMSRCLCETAPFSDADLMNLVILMQVVLNPSINFNGIIIIKMKNPT